MDVKNVNEAFLGFPDIENQIRETVENIRKHPLFSVVGLEVVGYIYKTEIGEMIKLRL
jgi:carbonic anhydrase